MSLSLIPILALGKIDPQAVVEKLRGGDYEGETKPNHRSGVKVRSEQWLELTRDWKNGIYTNSERDSVGGKIERIMVSSGWKSSRKRCENCLCDFDSDPIGQPVKHVSHKEDGITYHEFVCEGCYCCYECALSGIIYNGYNTNINSESFLRLMYRLHGYRDILRPTPNPRLLLENGGTLSREQWLSKEHIFVPTGLIRIREGQREYQQKR